MKKDLENLSPAREVPADDREVNGGHCVSETGRTISGIRKRVSKEIETPAPVVILGHEGEIIARREPRRGAEEESVIKAEGDLRVMIDAKGFYRSVSGDRKDKVKRKHEELSSRYPGGYRRMCEIDGGVATWQSEKDTERPPVSIPPDGEDEREYGLPPLSTLGDDDDTPLVIK